MTCTHSIVAIIAALACSHALAQLGNAPPSALSSQGNTVGRQVQSAPSSNTAGVAQSPAVVVGAPALEAAPKTGAVTPSQMAKPVIPTPSSLPPSSGVATQSGLQAATAANQVNAALDIIEPAAGSALTPGNLRVHVARPAGYAAGQQAEVEFTWLTPRQNNPATAIQPPPAVKVTTWQLALDQLAQGALVPRDKTPGWVGPTLVRMRTIGAKAGPWSNGVSFTLVSSVPQQASRAMGTGNTYAATTPSSPAAIPAGARPTAGPVLKIVEPAEASTHLPGAVRLRVTYPRELEGKTAEIEVSWQQPGTLPWWGLSTIVDSGATVWQLPIDQLGQGIIVPRDKTCSTTQTIDSDAAGKLVALTGYDCSLPKQAMVKVRIAGAMPEIWNDTVHFVIEVPKELRATTPPSPANAAGTQIGGAQNPRSLATQNPFNSPGGVSKAEPPPSALQPRP